MTTEPQPPNPHTIWSYYTPCGAFYGYVVLRPDGSIVHPQQVLAHTWELDEGELTLTRQDGSLDAILAPEGASWRGRHHPRKPMPAMLTPIITLSEPEPEPNTARKPIFINSIMKSGTYLAERWLAGLGWRATRLHLIGGAVLYDYRGVPDAQMHRREAEHRLEVGYLALAGALTPRDLLVGHVGAKDSTDALLQGGAHPITLGRNLRDVLVSFYRFKLDTVEDDALPEKCWRLVPEPERFFAYLIACHQILQHNLVQYIATVGSRPMLRYEELKACAPPKDVLDSIAAMAGVSPRSALAALELALGANTPTRNETPSHWRDFWSPRVEAYFAKSGLLEANRKLGYEP